MATVRCSGSHAHTKLDGVKSQTVSTIWWEYICLELPRIGAPDIITWLVSYIFGNNNILLIYLIILNAYLCYVVVWDK